MNLRDIAAAGICFFALAIAGTFYSLSEKQSAAAPDSFTAATTVETTEARYVPDGWREYKNTAHHFSLLYPQELTVSERSEGEGASTITFQNPKKGEGFQIFIVPYSKEQVSPERFKKDIPSGVRTDVSDSIIDGARGAAFYSTDALLGETREVWFIRSGWLYEVTTLKSLEAWLSQIMQTWQFL